VLASEALPGRGGGDHRVRLDYRVDVVVQAVQGRGVAGSRWIIFRSGAPAQTSASMMVRRPT
jgi:hypothetical protein